MLKSKNPFRLFRLVTSLNRTYIVTTGADAGGNDFPEDSTESRGVFLNAREESHTLP